MSTGGPDLFVICKSCGSEVSPYITECPYCGNRLRKRAPKLDRDQRVAERKAARTRRQPPPLLSRLRGNEIPGIRGDSRPYATLVLTLAGLIGTLLWRTALYPNLALFGQPGSHWWRLFTAAFVYDNIGYALITLSTIALFGWLMERRHGPAVVLALFLIGGVGGLAATTALSPNAIEMGAVGAALALLCAWATPDLLTLRSGGDVEGDIIGVAVIAVVVALMPLADVSASWIAAGVGVLAGFALGLPLARLGER
ncbi:MAG: rhomboid family intramembrane serine protease [Solirubrobacteraceae bacterium]